MENETDFDHIFREYYTPLFIFAKRYVSDDEDCHDLVNDVYEDAWSHFHDIRPESVQCYLYTDLRRKCIDYLRRKKTHQRYIELTKALTDHYDSTEHIRQMEERERYAIHVVNSLRPPTQEIFRLCFVERKKYAEAAQILGISVSTVKKHIVRALKLIRGIGNKESEQE